MDRAFDILNSKSKYGKFTKEPINRTNIADIKKVYKELRDYLLSLDDSNHQPLYSSRRKTFIVGFICTFNAVISLAEDLFQDKVVSYLPTFRISQDFIETLFSKVRRMGGHNNNPTAVHFKSALRNLIAKISVSASTSANCLDTESSTGLFALEWSKRKSPLPECQDVEDGNDIECPPLPSNLGIHKENITYYISGFMVRSLKGKVKCVACAQALVGLNDAATLPPDHCRYSAASQQDKAQLLYKVKDRGGLVAASQQVVKISQRCEKVITHFASLGFLSKPNPAQRLMALFRKSVAIEEPVSFFAHRCEIEEGALVHSDQLTQLLASRYFDIRIKHFVKLFNETIIEKKKGSDRNRLNRLVIFSHQ